MITTKKQPTQAELTEQVIQAMNAQSDAIADAFYKLREGDYYGDPLPDSLADIAKSLRILSGREELKK
jgi:hypothetical protein